MSTHSYRRTPPRTNSPCAAGGGPLFGEIENAQKKTTGGRRAGPEAFGGLNRHMPGEELDLIQCAPARWHKLAAVQSVASQTGTTTGMFMLTPVWGVGFALLGVVASAREPSRQQLLPTGRLRAGINAGNAL